MNKSTKIAISGILGAALLGGAAVAHNRGGSPMGAGYDGGGHHGGYFGGHPGGHFIERLSEQLELTAEQETQLDAAMDKMRELRRETRRQRRETRNNMLALLESPSLDQEKALELVTSNVRIMEQRAPDVITAIASFTDSLTPEQKRQVGEWFEQRMASHGPRRGR